MARIVSTKIEDSKVVVELETTFEEAQDLKGEISGIRLFAEGRCKNETAIAYRGKSNATKYFLVPKKYRHEVSSRRKARCYRMEHDAKQWFIFEVE